MLFELKGMPIQTARLSKSIGLLFDDKPYVSHMHQLH